jgi:two-component system CheB/CheR fusion protein
LNSTSKNYPHLVVAIGGSAGALSAFESIVEHLPESSGFSYIIIQHMGPEQRSQLPELLQKKTKLTVLAAKNGMFLEPDHIYVSRPGCSLELHGKIIHSHPIETLLERRQPIDHFFESLATSFGARAVAVVVSGTGADGSIGVAHIKTAGGHVVIQDPFEAKFDGMPRSAIDAVTPDYIVPCDAIGSLLTSLGKRVSFDTEVVVTEDEHLMKKIFTTLLQRTGHDFSAYKKTTVSRRIEKRLQANHLRDLAAYESYLEDHEAEAHALLSDLLISVTSFFRDPEAFRYLRENILPPLFSGVPKEDPIRVWIPACATGEEAYSFAMILCDFKAQNQLSHVIQIFATDIDKSALEVARAGRYSMDAVADIPSALLEKYFMEVNGVYQVKPMLRELCLFSEHNLIKDPPFSKLHLVSCRNLFIYWEAALQNKIVQVFNYALVTNGILFLGAADGLNQAIDAFETIDKKSKLYRKLNKPPHKHYSLSMNNSKLPPLQSAQFTEKTPSTERNLTKLIGTNLLNHFAPPAVVINEKSEIVFYSGQTGSFFESPTGAPTTNIFDLILRPLRPALHTLIFKAVKEKVEVGHPALLYEIDGKKQVVSLTVKPVQELTDLYLIVFQNVPITETQSEAITLSQIPGQDFFVQQLEAELKETKDHLQRTIEQVKSSNEELLSINEELQAANEELQTSKEELQSTNEELETVNAEVTHKVEELDLANSHLQNYFANTHVPILFLDHDLRIQKFTPTTSKIFRLIPSDIGRSISDIVSSLDDRELFEKLKHVLDSLQTIEEEITTKDKTTHYLLRITPYRPTVSTIGGVVLTLSDVTEVKKVQGLLAESYTQTVDILDSMGDAFFSLDSEWKITRVNHRHEEVSRISKEQNLGKNFWDLFPGAKDPESKYYQNYHRTMKDRISTSFVDHYAALDLWTEVNVFPTSDGGIAVLYRDITIRMQSEKLILAEKHKFEAIFEDSASSMALLQGEDFVFEKANANYLGLMGHREIIGKSLLEALPELRGQPFHQLMKDVYMTGKPFVATDMLARLVREKGKEPEDVYFDFTYSRVLDGEGKPYGIYIHAIDVTQKVLSKRLIEEAQGKLQVALKSAHMGTWDLNPQNYQVRWSERTNELFGVEELDELPLEKALAQIHPQDSARVQNAIQKALDPAGNGEYKIEYRVMKKDGDYRWLSLMGQTYFIETEAGRVATNFSGVVFDVTEQKHAEAELIRAVQSRDEFLSIASHELKTPLTSLKMQSQLRKRYAIRGDSDTFTKEKLIAMAKNDDDQINRINRLIDDMLDITRINSGKLSITHEEVPARELLNDVVNRFLTVTPEAGSTITIERCEDFIGTWDRFRVDQVITNLVTNAIKYGAGKPIAVTAFSRNGWAIFQVKDQGIGISKADQERIFGQFERAIHKNEISGLGLGLYIVKQIVESHRGKISVDSELSKGSTFTVELPLH